MRRLVEAQGVLLFLLFAFWANQASAAEPASCDSDVCNKRPEEKPNGVQEWGFGVSYAWHCQYDKAGECPYESYGIFGFGKLDFGEYYAFLLSGGAAASNVQRWVDDDGVKHTKTLIDLYLNIDYRVDIARFSAGSVASTIDLSAGGGIGLRLRIYVESTAFEFASIRANVPDINAVLQPYFHIFVLAGFSHMFVVLTADMRDTASVTAAFGLGF